MEGSSGGDMKSLKLSEEVHWFVVMVTGTGSLGLSGVKVKGHKTVVVIVVVYTIVYWMMTCCS